MFPVLLIWLESWNHVFKRSDRGKFLQKLKAYLLYFVRDNTEKNMDTMFFLCMKQMWPKHVKWQLGSGDAVIVAQSPPPPPQKKIYFLQHGKMTILNNVKIL